MVGCSKIFTPQSKYSIHWWGLFVSPAAIKFTVMWLLMSVFFLSTEKIESTDATEGTQRGIPCEWDPCCRDPLSGDRNPLWFCTLVKVNTPLPPLCPRPPYITAVLRSAQVLLPRMGLYSEAGQPDVCSSRGSFSLFLILFELSSRGKQAKCVVSLSLYQGMPKWWSKGVCRGNNNQPVHVVQFIRNKNA